MNKIGNDVMKVSTGIEMNEKDYSICLLSTLKDMEKNYTIAMTEASNEWLYNIYKDIFIQLSDLQRKLYTVMFQCGWYQLETVTDAKLNEKYQTFQNEYKDLSS